MKDHFTLEKCEQVSDILKSLSHPHRLWILCILSEGEKTVNEIVDEVDLPQPTVSRHLIRMKREGILDCRREGQYIYYSIHDPKVMSLMTSMYEIFCMPSRKKDDQSKEE